jgi:hypothetical protein
VKLKYRAEYFNNQFPSRSIRAELADSDTCSALGITVKSESPVLGLRKLLDAGYKALALQFNYDAPTLGKLRQIRDDLRKFLNHTHEWF